MVRIFGFEKILTTKFGIATLIIEWMKYEKNLVEEKMPNNQYGNHVNASETLNVLVVESAVID